MKTRAVLALAAVSGLAASAQAQELIKVSYSWLEVQGLTTTPVTNPNSVLDTGEGARISISIQALINGTSAIGQTTTYTPPPPPGNGTIRGIASMIYNMTGDNNAATAAGSWGTRSIAPLLSAGAFTGNVTNNGATVDSFGGGQFVAPGGTANSTNPIANAFRGVWQPSSYTSRTVNFKATAGTAAPLGQQNGVMLAYGVTQPDPQDPTTWFENYFTKFIGSDFQTGINIPIAGIPAPSSVALLGLGALVAGRRRR